jgi:site-specific DNA-cytosine methylase
LTKLRIGSLFTGVSGLELGLLKDPKFELTFVADPDKYCAQVLAYLHPNTPNLGSVTQLVQAERLTEIPDVDLIMGGTSCQNFSYQGDKTGLEGVKSKLFYEFAKIIQFKQPKYVVWENVVGAATHKDFKIVKEIFEEIGYEIDYDIFNAREYSGTIQQRRRIILLATRKDLDQVRLNRTIPGIELSQEMRDLKERLVGVSKSHRSGEEDEDGNEIVPERIEVRVNRGIANTQVTGWGCAGVSTKNYVQEDDGTLRELNINESELLMTWPKDHTKFGILNGKTVEISMAQRYKMCGNGVVSELIPSLLRDVK